MKQVGIFILVLLLGIMLSGCDKDNHSMVTISRNRQIKVEDGEKISSYSVNQDGIMYIATTDYIIDYSSHNSMAYIHRYSKEGNRDITYQIPGVMNIKNMIVDQDVAYFTVIDTTKNKEVPILYSYNFTTEEMTTLYEFNGFGYIKQMVRMEQNLYILGMDQYEFKKNLNKTDPYPTSGETLVYYSIEDSTVHQINITQPISIFGTSANTLMVNSYDETEGYCMMEYQPKDDSLLMVQRFPYHKFDEFALIENDKYLLYRHDYRQEVLILSPLEDIVQETEIVDNITIIEDYGIHFINESLYYIDSKGYVEQMNIKDIHDEKTEITYVMTGNRGYEAFGAGYKMKRLDLSPEEYTLKVLAGDRDYDISVISSYLGQSYNIKEKGAYYPLNNIKGVEEYLDACFPYVKEAAMNEQGDVWMIPLQVDITSYLINTDSIDKDNIVIPKELTYGEYCELIQSMQSSGTMKYNCSTYSLYLNLFNYMFQNQVDIDSQLFRDTASQIKLIQDRLEAGNHNSLYVLSNEFYMDSVLWETTYSYIKTTLDARLKVSGNSLAESDQFIINSYPKLYKEDKNLGDCIFLTVNKNSKNLKKTLAFVEHLIENTMKQEEKPYFFSEKPETMTPLRQSVYNLYENGEIVFTLTVISISMDFSATYKMRLH